MGGEERLSARLKSREQKEAKRVEIERDLQVGGEGRAR